MKKGQKVKNIIRFPFAAALLMMPACGGGGDEVPNYAGAWNINVSVVSNTCPRQIPEEFVTILNLHNVNQSLVEDQDGEDSLEIVLEDGTDTYYGLGNLNRNGGGYSFSVTGTPHELSDFIRGFTCIESIDYSFDSMNLTPDDLNTVYANYVVRHSTIICNKGSDVRTCDVTYTGSAYGVR